MTTRDYGNATLEQLEGIKLDDEPSFSSHLVTECHRLYRIPLVEFSIENLRIMIGQSLGLKYLVPLALDELEKDPWVSGDFYEGDLLLALLRADASYWEQDQGSLFRLTSIIDELQKRKTFLEEEILPKYLRIFGGRSE